jgi:two-component system sensor histidine kinase KdpD
VAMTPVKLGMRPMGSLALIGSPPSEQMVRAIANLVALTIEKARALEDASQAEAARQSEALKAALLDSLAHDIKTPLTSIKAAVTSLLGRSGGGNDNELLTIINEEADRLNELAAEVVEMARIEAGKLHLEKAPVEVGELVSVAISPFTQALKERPFSVHLPENLPAAEADQEFAGQVVKQLVENALKYTPEGSPIEISAAVQNGKIVLGVADHGPGIDESEQARIFDKFFRGKRHRFETQGTGMGLAIAKGIAEAHGERIWVESEPGQGSVFYFTLPVSRSGGDGK